MCIRDRYILSLAEKLDADMNQMMTNNPSASIATAAVITALGYLDELKKSTSGADNMRAVSYTHLAGGGLLRMPFFCTFGLTARFFC